MNMGNFNTLLARFRAGHFLVDETCARKTRKAFERGMQVDARRLWLSLHRAVRLGLLTSGRSPRRAD